jgi:hypothetical protein
MKKTILTLFMLAPLMLFSQGSQFVSIGTSTYNIDTTLTYSFQAAAGYQLLAVGKPGDEFGFSLNASLGYELFRDLNLKDFKASPTIGISAGINNEYDMFLHAGAKYSTALKQWSGLVQAQLYPIDEGILKNFGFTIDVGARQIGERKPTAFISIGFIFLKRKS